MKTNSNHIFRQLLPSLLIIFFLIGPALLSDASGQNRINILEANRIEGGQYQGERVQKILGDVYLESDNLEMYCDSAYQFVNTSEIRAFGNIQVNTEAEKIWADTLIYFTDVDFSQLRGRVIIEADSTTLFGNSVDYRFTTKVAHFLDKTRLEDQRGILLADSGFYFREADSAQFRGQVQLKDSLQYLEGDSLFSNRNKKYYELYGEVFGDDQENNTKISGNYLEADSTGRRLLKGNDAWLQNFETDTTRADSADTTVTTRTDTTTSIPKDTTQTDNASSLKADTTASVQTDTTVSTRTDTTHIRAKTILSLEQRSPNDTTAIVFGYDSVRIWSPSFSSVSDTSKYNDSTDTFEIWSNSKAWHKQVQLTGPYINAKLVGGEIDSLKSYPRPFSVQQDTTIDRLNQITGDTLHADFKDGALNQIYVFGKSHLLRFTKNKQGKPDGGVDLTAPEIRIFFEKGELKEMKATGKVDGSYLPENEKTAKRRLDGFSWNPDLRPQRPKQKMQRRFPPVSDHVFFELPRRYLEHLKKNHPESKKLEIQKD